MKISEFMRNNDTIRKNLDTLFSVLVESLKTDFTISLSKFLEIKFKHIDDNLKKAGERSNCNLIKFLIEIKNINSNIDISEDLESLKNSKIYIENLIIFRDKYHTHFDIEYFNDPDLLKDIKPLRWIDLKNLVELINKILNKYSSVLEEKGYYPHLREIELEIPFFLNIIKDYFDRIKLEKENYINSLHVDDKYKNNILNKNKIMEE
ncbi:MAG TPA: hypothetical protein VIK14_01580 [Ignavibacteria bacterium]